MEEQLGSNPFMNGLKIHVSSVSSGSYYSVDGMMLPRDVLIEKKPFSKVYLTADDRKLVMMLTDSALRLFLWVIYELKAGEDHVCINRERYMKESDIQSINTFKKAISELERYFFISASLVKGVYFINPSFIFRGNRIKKFNLNLVNE